MRITICLGNTTAKPTTESLNIHSSLSLSLASIRICLGNLVLSSPPYHPLPFSLPVFLFFLSLLTLSLSKPSTMARTTPILHQNNLLFTSRTKTSHSFFNSPKSLSSLSLSSLPPSPKPFYRITRVSTAPVGYAPPSSPDGFDFHAEISRLKSLRSLLSHSETLTDKLRVIDADFRVNRFFSIGVCRVLNYLKVSDYDLFLLKCVVAAGQEHVLGSISESVEGDFESARGMLKTALYYLVDMIEKSDVSGGEGVKSEVEEEVKGEEIGALRKLLKTLGQMEEFYDCIGGIIGLVSISITN